MKASHCSWQQREVTPAHLQLSKLPADAHVRFFENAHTRTLNIHTVLLQQSGCSWYACKRVRPHFNTTHTACCFSSALTHTHTYTHASSLLALALELSRGSRPPSQMPLFHDSVIVALYNSCSLITWLTVCIYCKSNCNQTTECGTSQLVRLEVFVVVNSGKKVSVQQPCSSVLMNSSVNNSQ